MSRILYLSPLLWLLVCSCQLNEPKAAVEEKSYYLFRAGYEPVHGEVVFSNLGDGTVGVSIDLQNTDARFDFPAHLHFGSIKEVGELAIRLEDVDGATGKSVTDLKDVVMPNGEQFRFEMLDEFNGSVKIHLAEGVLGQYVLTYGNIGANENYFADGITVCTGH